MTVDEKEEVQGRITKSDHTEEDGCISLSPPGKPGVCSNELFGLDRLGNRNQAKDEAKAEYPNDRQRERLGCLLAGDSRFIRHELLALDGKHLAGAAVFLSSDLYEAMTAISFCATRTTINRGHIGMISALHDCGGPVRFWNTA